MPTTVFLSHAIADLDLVVKVEQHMRPLDVKLYKYEDDPQGGGSLALKLDQRIRESDVVVVLLTKNSELRPSLHSEVGIARTLGKLIIPVIELGLDAHQFVFLQGLEWVVLDTANIDHTLLQLQLSVKHYQDAAHDNAQVIGVLLILIGVLLVYWAMSQKKLNVIPV
jgi:hypothetical protein